MEGILIILLPLFAFLITAVFGRRLGDLASGVITVLGGFFSFLFSLKTMFDALREPFVLTLYTFLPLEEGSVNIGFYFDALSTTMATVVTGVATLIFLYSIGYMHNEFGKWVYKFYTYLSLFLFSMLLIVLSDNLIGIFAGWEGVGLASYLLIGYYHGQKKATDSGYEAFVMNRVGDWLFIFGIISVYIIFGTLSVEQINRQAQQVEAVVLTVPALLLFGGAVGKSGQYPLHTWLPNAMAGPTPVSALLHAATMVAAGVYLVARLYPIFENTPIALKVVALIGGATALLSALAATSHTDIKKIVAFSTMSQLGYMYMALGVGDEGGAMYHLTTHAFFKALLFLAAGSVITAFHHRLYDIYQYGGLRKHMPVTYASFLTGALALGGIFPLSGFWSKDRLISGYYEAGYIYGVLGTVVAFLTAYYIFREAFVVFHGEGRYRGQEPREVGAIMTVPMLILGIMAIVAGIFEGWFFRALGDQQKPIHLDVALLSVGVGLGGIVLAYLVFVKRYIDPHKAYESLKSLHTTFREQFFTEKLYHGVIARGYLSYSRILYGVGERQFIDGLVNGVAQVTQSVGQGLRFLQAGRLNWYALGISAGSLLLVGILLSLITGGGS
jgi:NADH-quinone oxidoreductase subunit L